MYKSKELENILFLDIETASATQDYSGLNPRMQELWDKKSKLLLKREEEEFTASEMFHRKAAIFSEFGRVVCISAGYIHFENEVPSFRIKSYFGADETEILLDFTKMLDKWTGNPERTLCAHNGKEFDFPYLGRRFLINSLPIPLSLQIQGKKPWEVKLMDTMELWKFGDYKSYTSLDLLTAVLEIPTPKDDIDGSQVGTVYWVDKDYERIKVYCEKDVIATAQVLLRFARMPLIKDENVSSV